MLLKDNRKNNFLWVENLLIDSEELDIYEKMVYITLVRFTDKNSSCYPSIATIAKKVGCSDKKVQKTMKTLVEKNLIKKVNRTRSNGQIDSNLYYVNSIDDIKNNLNDEDLNTNNIGNDVPNIGNDVPNIGNDVPCDREPRSQMVGNDVPINKNHINNTHINIYIDLTFIDETVTHVKVTESDYKKLIDRFDKNLVENKILQLENYIQNGKGKKYKNHYLVLLNWCRNSNLSDNKKVVNAINEFETY